MGQTETEKRPPGPRRSQPPSSSAAIPARPASRPDRRAGSADRGLVLRRRSPPAALPARAAELRAAARRHRACPRRRTRRSRTSCAPWTSSAPPRSSSWGPAASGEVTCPGTAPTAGRAPPHAAPSASAPDPGRAWTTTVMTLSAAMSGCEPGTSNGGSRYPARSSDRQCSALRDPTVQRPRRDRIRPLRAAGKHGDRRRLDGEGAPVSGRVDSARHPADHGHAGAGQSAPERPGRSPARRATPARAPTTATGAADVEHAQPVDPAGDVQHRGRRGQLAQPVRIRRRAAAHRLEARVDAAGAGHAGVERPMSAGHVVGQPAGQGRDQLDV